MTLDEIALRLAGAGDQTEVVAERIAAELAVESAQRFPKAPLAAHGAYARAMVRRAVVVATDRWALGAGAAHAH